MPVRKANYDGSGPSLDQVMFQGNPIQQHFRKWSVLKVEAMMNVENPVDWADLLSHFMKMRKANGEPAEFGEMLIEAMNTMAGGGPKSYTRTDSDGSTFNRPESGQADLGRSRDEFKPARWLESFNRANYLNVNNITFGGSDPRTYIGRNIALPSDCSPDYAQLIICLVD
ncbi:uncharacterized protein BDZ99DRAFT_567397 [Mytilinidion resinicola]|uniref:Uncharacterized protein n=1 Tax=Mytilinidion resinicola TaxID=574789 RepID=A0A6A6Z359_9PEZI|nr:uncharacterized protein BDZ99DRAFT_567397 [Mytilinidion resinicola]KAF2815571.1 hypothetical protein BDZ99DRAFT_567397 [Mytilinidion resinicola]